MTSYRTLACEMVDEHIAVLTLNRPEAANALNTEILEDLRHFWDDVYIEPGARRCIVVTGAGRKAFCAGGDLKQRDGMNDADWRRQHAIGEQVFKRIMESPIPTIAAVNGACLGGGCELALACDFIYAARSARFGLPEVTRGIIPGGCGTQNLPRACGHRRAAEMILSGQVYSAEQAERWGIVNKICEDDALMGEALAIARVIAANAPIAVRQAKRSLSVATQTDLGTGYAFELAAYNQLVPTEDRLEGVRAFNERRKPVFKGK